MTAKYRVSDVAGQVSSLDGLLRWRAFTEPDKLAYRFLIDGETKEVSLTYAQVDNQARIIAGHLESLGATGERVLLLYPPGIEFIPAFFGCLYAGAVAVPAYPPDPDRLNRSLPRLKALVADAQTSVACTTDALRSATGGLFASIGELSGIRWLATDLLPDRPQESRRKAYSDLDDLAFIQYTSGSTGVPKGVMLAHGNLLHNASMVFAALGHTSEDVYLSWLPVFHDMGFMAGILEPLYAGIPAILMSPLSFLQRPVRWLEAIGRYRGTISGGPSFAYDLCLRKITPEERSGLNLSTWRRAFNGAEPIRHETLEKFTATFEPCGFGRTTFYPCYGLAEATLIVSGGVHADPPVIKRFETVALEANKVEPAPPGRDGAITLVGCGSALFDQSIAIVDPISSIACPTGRVGEIWISGPSVAKGYWNAPEGTESVFGARLADTGEGPFLRTGDLGFVEDGELFITGRLKDLLIIRGLNHYPQDIELTVEKAHAALRPGCGAAFSVEVENEERLVIVHEVDEQVHADCAAVIENARQAVAEYHDLQLYAVALLRPGTLPKTSSGKIQRRACRTEFLERKLKTVAEWRANPAEPEMPISVLPAAIHTSESIKAWLVSQLSARLGIGRSEISTEKPIVYYGLDSLAAVELMHSMNSALGINLPIAGFLGDLSIAQLAVQLVESIKTSPGSRPGLITNSDKSAEHPLSHGQRALWFLNQVAPDSTAYNIACAMRMRTDVDVAALKYAFQILVDRHACLRTTFGMNNGQPVQRVEERMEVCFVEEDASTWSGEFLDYRLGQEADHRFNLTEGPLFRLNLFIRPANECVLLIVVHHIVTDFWSLGVLIEEMGIIYGARRSGAPRKLDAPVVEYLDYVRWQAEMLEGPEGDRLWSYWKEQLAGELPSISLTYRTRPPLQTFRGATRSFTVNGAVAQRLRSLAQTENATLYMVMLAAFKALIHRYTAQEDIAVGSPTAGRGLPELGRIVGYFVNPVVVRSRLSGGQTFRSFLAQVRQTLLGAFEHQEYPFPLLVERLQPNRDPSRSPLFQIMFVWQKSNSLKDANLARLALGEGRTQMSTGGLEFESMFLEQRGAQFDLALMMTDLDRELGASVTFSTDLFEASTIERMIGHLQAVFASVAEDPGQRLSELKLMSEDEVNHILRKWNDTATNYPGHKRIHEVFEEQVELRSESIAVASEHLQVTYGELNRRANQVADLLRVKGVGIDGLVGVCLERSVDMVVGLLGILKAGAAYLPLDPTYPPKRLSYIVADSAVALVLTHSHLAEKLVEYRGELICLDKDRELIARGSEKNRTIEEVGDLGDALAYVIYTSGSTGQPKAAMNTHKAIRNRIIWSQESYPLTNRDRVLQKTPFSFDVSVWEFFWPLMTGACLVLARPEGHKDSRYLVELIAAQEITTVHFVPSMLQMWLDEDGIEQCASLRRIICSGEALAYDQQERLFGRVDAQLVNLYGPTEAAVEVTYWNCRSGELNVVPIGYPIANTQIYLLDEHHSPVPIGVPGELHIAGEGLARGYLESPDKTAERFIPNPYGNAGSRLYRTGDLARHFEDGSIAFLGRIDHQVKIRGCRIELGEIEATLNAHPSVRESAVLATGEDQREKRLVGYVVPSAMEGLSAAEIRDFLKTTLPDYMVPSALVIVDELPKTQNGKLDRKALLASEQSGNDLIKDVVAPRTPMEMVLTQIWSEVLGVNEVGISDNFFALGGHSLLITRVLSRVHDAFDIELPMAAFFREPTIGSLAVELIQCRAAQLDGDTMNGILNELELLSEDQIETILKGKIESRLS